MSAPPALLGGIEAAPGHLLVEEVRRIARETALEAVAAGPAIAAPRAPPSRWVTPPAAARETGIPVKTVRAMIKAGLVKSRLRNRSATPGQPKFLVNIDQVVQLTTDPRMPEDRRMLYALRLIGGGLRPSSEANARWRDRGRRPLWRLTISSAFDTLNKTEKPFTKTGVDYLVPIHPMLVGMLTSWWEAGWERFIGRPPTADDLIVPRQDATQRRVNVSLEQFHADLDTLGLPRQRQYESRATFRNLTLRAGANPFHVDLITHPKAKSASDLYTRVEQQWEGMCAAVLCINAGAWASPATGVTAEGDRYGTEKAKAPEPGRGFRGRVVTRTGIEPMLSA